MSESSTESASPAWPHAASDRARESENWRPPADDYPAAEGGAGAWSELDPPGQAPRPMVGTGVAYRVGWLQGSVEPDDGGPGAA